MQPTVRTLDELTAYTNPLYNPQRQAVNQQITQAGTAGQAEEQGLIAQQQQAFKDITQQANNRGMFFSGFAPDQQAQYNSTKFMPAMASLRGKVQDNIARLQSALLGLDTDQRKQVMGMQQDDQSKLYSWQQEQERRRYEKEQADIAYQRELQKMAREQSFQRSMKSSGSQGPSQQEQFASALASAAGGDGRVSPGDYNALKKQWVSAGYGDYKSFHDNFWKFADDSHWWDYYYG